jgi:radical SAM protein with 4Fe4S-binding SPASM domain
MVIVKLDGNLSFLTPNMIHDESSVLYRQYRKSWKEYPANFVLRDFPMHLDIEATSRCNLKCSFCDRQPYLDKSQIGDMDFGLFKSIIDEGRDHALWAVKLSYRGEPLLHKDIFKMISYAKKKGVIDVYFNTNATLLDKEAAQKIIDAGLDRVSISIEGTTAQEYQKMRINARFDTVFKNLKYILALKKKNNSKYPKIRIQSVEHPGFDAGKYSRFWAGYCDEVAVLTFTDMSRPPDNSCLRWACPQLWQRMTIEWDGTVFACNNDKLRLLAAGNLKDKTIYDCWHDRSVEKVRCLHRLGRFRQARSCNECPWRMGQLSKIRSAEV